MDIERESSRSDADKRKVSRYDFDDQNLENVVSVSAQREYQGMEGKTRSMRYIEISMFRWIKKIDISIHQNYI